MPTIEIPTIEIPTIDTERLRLRSFREADTEPLCAMLWARTT
jgi:hypothetical protein